MSTRTMHAASVSLRAIGLLLILCSAAALVMVIPPLTLFAMLAVSLPELLAIIASLLAGGLAAYGLGLLISRPRRLMITGHCPSCRYDLRGADHDVCPECGNAVK